MARPIAITRATTPSIRSVLLALEGFTLPAASVSQATKTGLRRAASFPLVTSFSNSFDGRSTSSYPWPKKSSRLVARSRA